MGLKDLFIVNENSKKEPKVETTPKFTTKFPSGNNIVEPVVPVNTITEVTPVDINCDPHIDTVIELYEKGFANLNLPGYDYYEFLQAVTAGGIDNPHAYQMAYTMGQSMDSSITKEKLIEQSQHYLSEIDKVYNQYVQNGQTKRNEVSTQKSAESTQLSEEISELNNKIATLQESLAIKQTQLAQIDAKYDPILSDLDCKILANDTAKNKLVETITKVTNRINSNIK